MVDISNVSIPLGDVLFGNLSQVTKHEIVEWLWASEKITDEEYTKFDSIAWTWDNGE